MLEGRKSVVFVIFCPNLGLAAGTGSTTNAKNPLKSNYIGRFIHFVQAEPTAINSFMGCWDRPAIGINSYVSAKDRRTLAVARALFFGHSEVIRSARRRFQDGVTCSDPRYAARVLPWASGHSRARSK